jgi:predicted glycosyltransferase
LKICIDILTPKQVLFFKSLVEELKKNGYDVTCTSRFYRELNLIEDKIGLDTIKVGTYGGSSLYGKLIASSKRILQLSKLMNDLKPHMAISFCSPEYARAAYGLGIKHLSISDSPHAKSVCKLTLPLSQSLLTPWIIPSSAWIGYGISKNNIIKYKALDPASWLKRIDKFEPLKFNGDRSKKTIIIRLEESSASYLLDSNKSWTFKIIDVLLKNFDECNLVVLGRYENQIKTLRKKYDRKIKIPKKFILGYNLLKNSDLLVGMGGTMNAEAALMGVPTISAFQGENTYVENYLIRNKLLVKPRNLENLIFKAKKLVYDKNEKRFLEQKAKKLLQEMEDPIAKIVSVIAKFK